MKLTFSSLSSAYNGTFTTVNTSNAGYFTVVGTVSGPINGSSGTYEGIATATQNFPVGAYIQSKTASTVVLSKPSTGAVTISPLTNSIYLNAYAVDGYASVRVLGETDAEGNPRNRMTETNVYGQPVVGAVLDKVYIGGAGGTSAPTKYNFYFIGNPLSGTIKINFKSLMSAVVDVDVLNGFDTATLASNYIENQINNAYKSYDPAQTSGLVTVLPGDSTSATTLVPNSLNPFIITFKNNSLNESFSIYDVFLSGGSGDYNSDIVLQDDELATLPDGVLVNGVLDISTVMTVRVKSQSTWNIE